MLNILSILRISLSSWTTKAKTASAACEADQVPQTCCRCPQDLLVLTTLALVVATNQPEIKTWMVLVRANLIRRIPPQSSFFSKQSVSFHRLSVCLVFPHISPAGSLYGRAVDRQATQSLGQRKRTTGKLAGHTGQRHSLNLFAPALS